MSGSDAGSGSSDPQSEASSHKEVLDELMNEIDRSQDIVDSLHDQITETEIDLSHVRSELAQLRRIQDTHSIDSSLPLPTCVFDVNKLSLEHRDFVNDFMDRIYDVEMKVEQQETKNRQLTDEADGLSRENERLEKQIRAFKLQTMKFHQERRQITNLIQNTESRLKEELSALRSNAQTMKLEELAISGLIERREDLEHGSGGNLDLECLLVSLNDEIASHELEVDMQEHETQNLRERTQSDLRDLDGTIAQTTRIANWITEKERILAEIERIGGEIRGIRERNLAENRKFNKQTVRYRQLVPIVRKWKGKELPAARTEGLDWLLAQAARGEGQDEGSVAASDLATETLSNGEMNARIQTYREELERMLHLFRVESQRLKGEIETARENSFAPERKILEQINTLKVKIAQRRMAQKA
jgi:hypothetical protein